MSTASQHSRADTHVSPSHSQSKVSPIPVQGYGVQQGFKAKANPWNVTMRSQVPVPRTTRSADVMLQSQIPNTVHNPVPVPVQVPTIPVAHRVTGNDVRGNARPNGSIPSQHQSHYKSSPNLRPHPAHAHPSGSTSFDGNDSLASTSNISVDTDDMNTYTDQMSKALEQFDSLLTKSPSIIQTSF
jgi:hypothetical protein